MTRNSSNSPVSEEELHQLSVFVEMGLSSKDIAEALGRHINTVTKWKKRLGYTKRQWVTEEERDRWVGMHADGLTPQEISEKVGRHRVTVYQHLLKSGISFSREGFKGTRPPKKTHCKRGHDLDVYGGPNYARKEHGLWVNQGRICRGCTNFRKGYDLPSPERVASTNKKAHEKKAAENAKIRAKLSLQEN